MLKKVSSKLNNNGAALIIVVLAAGVIALLTLLLVRVVTAHFDQEKLYYDITQVESARKAAKVQYLYDGCPKEGVTYYFDAERCAMVGLEELETINGYGRSDKTHNKDSKTGAKGIPYVTETKTRNLLALSFDPDGNLTARWQGKRLTFYDYTIMTYNERDRLNAAQRDQIEADKKKNGIVVEE